MLYKTLPYPKVGIVLSDKKLIKKPRLFIASTESHGVNRIASIVLKVSLILDLFKSLILIQTISKLMFRS
ncbi:hypothetical protein IKD48_02765 [bacterium]|nr:hypothetical protein [bacterium]